VKYLLTSTPLTTAVPPPSPARLV